MTPSNFDVMAPTGVESVFINMPYAEEYEERLLALIAGLSLYGVIPTAAIVSGNKPARLDRIIEGLSQCVCCRCTT